MKNLIITIALVLASSQLLAETRYVTDQLEITLRSGQSTKHQILRMLPSGQAVEVLEDDEESQYTRIRTEQGNEGWVITRYLDSQPSARERLAASEIRNVDLNARIKTIQNELQQAQAEIKQLSSTKSALDQQNQQLQSELNRIKRVSANVISIDKENTDLNAQLQLLQQQNDQAQQQISALQDSTARDWFMVGAGVILLGMIIGLIIPKIRWRKKSSWDSL